MTLLTSMNWSTFLTVLKTDPTQQLFKKILKVEDNRPIYIRKIHKPGLSKVDQFRRWIVFTPTRSNGKPADYNHFKIYCPRPGHLNCSHTNPSLISAHNIKLLIAPDPPPQIIFKSAPSPIKNSRLISLGLTKDAKKSTIKEVLRNKAMLNDLPSCDFLQTEFGLIYDDDDQKNNFFPNSLQDSNLSLAKWIVANYDQTDYNQHECGEALIIAVTNGNLLGCQWLFTTFSNIFNDPESDLFPQSDILESFIFSAQENSKIHFDICKLIHQTFNINSLIEDDNDRNKLCQLKKNLTIREDFKDWFNEVFNE